MSKRIDLVVKNRPFYHYLLSVYSLLLQKEGMTIRGWSRASSRAIDLVNLLTYKIAPGIFQTPIPIRFGREQMRLASGGKFSLSYVQLVPRRARKNPSKKGPEEGKQAILDRTFGPRSENKVYDFTICELELFLSNRAFRKNIDKLVIESPYRIAKVKDRIPIPICGITLGESPILEPDEFFWKDIVFEKNEDNNRRIINRYKDKFPGMEDEAIVEKIRKTYSHGDTNTNSLLVNALIRAGILKSGGLREFSQLIAFFDDVVLGLDTNMFYNCMVTSNLLDTFLGTPKSDFLDPPNWILFLISEVSVGEIECNASIKDAQRGAKQREACRALQEIMELRRCADLEGICFLNVGSIPPEFDFSRTPSSIRDAIIREQIKTFLRQLNFPKGTYFLTQDRVCAMLAEAEGMRSIRVKKPNLKETSRIELQNEDTPNISEILCELGVSFQPLVVKAMRNDEELLSFQIKTDWEGKDLKDWEHWKLRLKVFKNDHNLLEEIHNEILSLHKSKCPDPYMLIEGWRNLQKRYVSWDMR